MRFWLLLILVGCQTSSKLDQVAAGSGSAGSARGSAVDAAKLDQLVGELAEYTDRLVPLALAWDGDCDHYIARLLELEPLVKQIRAHTAELEAADRTADLEIEIAYRQKKPEMEPRIDAQLAAAGKTRGDIEALGAVIQKQCGSDPRLADAMNRVGVFKKKH